jgi:FkbM family methyltransferase
MLSKGKTTLTLLLHGELSKVPGLIALNLRRQRAKLGGRPFVHRRLGFPFPCFPNVPDSLDTYLKGSSDGLELALVKEWVEPGDSAVDIGANLGMYSCAVASAAGKAAVVLAVEPAPQLARQIELTSRLLSIEPLAVSETCAGEEPGSTEFYVAADGTPSGEQSRRSPPGREGDYVRINVRMETLDNLVVARLLGAAPSFVKLDVEGAEVAVLRGAERTLDAPDNAFWLVEINPNALERFGFRAQDVLGFFPPGRFERWIIPQYPLAAPSRRARLLGDGEAFGDAVYYNLAALPRAGRFAGRSPGLRRLLNSA